MTLRATAQHGRPCPLWRERSPEPRYGPFTGPADRLADIGFINVVALTNSFLDKVRRKKSSLPSLGHLVTGPMRRVHALTPMHLPTDPHPQLRACLCHKKKSMTSMHGCTRVFVPRLQQKPALTPSALGPSSTGSVPRHSVT